MKPIAMTRRAMKQRRTALRWLGSGVLTAVTSSLQARVSDSGWPSSRTIRLLVAYPVGGVSDQVARDLAQQLSAQLSVQVIVENRPGAAGSIAMEIVMRSASDGHTLGFAAVSALRSPHMVVCADRSAYPSGDSKHAGKVLALTPVAGVMHTPVLIAGTRALSAASFGDMLRWAYTRPDAIRWATTGEGTTGHAVLQHVSRASGIQVVHVPYKGGGQQIVDAIGGHFEVLSTNVAHTQLRAIAAGQLSALAVGTPKRLLTLPDTPTLAELGFPQANLDSLFGVFVAPHTPAEIVFRIHAAVTRALHHSPLAGKLVAMSNIPFAGSVRDFEAEVVRRTQINPHPEFPCK